MVETAFQPNAFQNDAFQIGAGPIPTVAETADGVRASRRDRELEDEMLRRIDEELLVLLS